jgi:hypothetical protein
MTQKATSPALRWQKLPRNRQFLIALRLASARQALWKRRFANVQNIGAGFRTRGKDAIEYEEVVLRFVVTAKRGRIRQGKIPKTIRVLWKFGRQRRALDVPTDVFVHHRGKLHDGFIGTVSDGRSFRGSACCVCQDADQPNEPTYLLSCHHVLTGSILDANNPPRPIPGTKITRNGALAGPCTLAGDLAPGPGAYAMDAAFLRLDLPTSATAIAGYWDQVRPQRMAKLDEIPDPQATLGIFSYRGMIPARYVGMFPNMDVEIRPGIHVRFEYVTECEANTKEGDSGAALMDDKGVVFGVHFYGGRSDKFVNGYSLAIPTWTIVGSSHYFSRNFVVANPHP